MELMKKELNIQVNYSSEGARQLLGFCDGDVVAADLLFLIFFFFMRQLQSGGGKAAGFGKSRHKIMNESTKKVTFADIAGIDEAKEELGEIIDFLREPKKFTRLEDEFKGCSPDGPSRNWKDLVGQRGGGRGWCAFLQHLGF